MSLFTGVVKKTVLSFTVLLLLVGLTACTKQDVVIPNLENAIGVLILNGDDDMPSGKTYAKEENNSFMFSLDAAGVYYFQADAKTSYAGEQNLTSLTFEANIETNIVGAKGQIAYRPMDDSDNVVSAYYLYHDEQGVYFYGDKAFQKLEILESSILVGTDYPCSIEFFYCEPAEQFKVMMLDSSSNLLEDETYKVRNVEDYQKIMVPADTATVEWVSYDSDGRKLYHDSLGLDASRFVVCYDSGGQILSSKLLRLFWHE